MNQETEEDNKIKWKNFKNLKTEYSTNGDSMDLCDLAYFYKSFVLEREYPIATTRIRY